MYKYFWVKWIYTYLLRQESFWSVREKSNIGSWMWRKLLKLRDIAKSFHKVEIRSGRNTSFWHDNWSSFGRLDELLGDRGCIDLGIRSNTTMAEVIRHHRRRRHRVVIFNKIEDELEQVRAKASVEEDVHKWKQKTDKFATKFSSKNTWKLIREEQIHIDWDKIVWFTHATPKYAFLLWTALHNRLATGDRMRQWSQHIDTYCVLCHHPMETKNHLFFASPYSAQVWEQTAKGIMGRAFSTDWNDLVGVLKDRNGDQTKQLVLRYAFQATIYTIWWECNRRKHGEEELLPLKLVKTIDKTVRNRLSAIRLLGDYSYDGSLMLWFATRV